VSNQALAHPPTRESFSLIVHIMTRWNDYDMLGHVNNVEYYRYFETAILTLLQETGLNWQTDPVIPLAAENGCRFLKPVAVCGHVEVGIRIARLGNSSVRYEVAVFMPEDPDAYATGFFCACIYQSRNRPIDRNACSREATLRRRADGERARARAAGGESASFAHSTDAQRLN